MSHLPRITRCDTALAAARSGGPLALAELVSRVRPYVLAVAKKLASNPADAEEIAQDALLALVRNIERFEARCSLETWVYTLVRSQASHRFRRMRPLPSSAVGVYMDDPRDPHDDLERWELHDDLERALAELSELDRTILVKRDYDGRHAQDVADELGISVPAVKSRLHRARITVRQQLAPTHASAA